jgi:hypothetical protein
MEAVILVQRLALAQRTHRFLRGTVRKGRWRWAIEPRCLEPSGRTSPIRFLGIWSGLEKNSAVIRGSGIGSRDWVGFFGTRSCLSEWRHRSLDPRAEVVPVEM